MITSLFFLICGRKKKKRPDFSCIPGNNKKENKHGKRRAFCFVVQKKTNSAVKWCFTYPCWRWKLQKKKDTFQGDWTKSHKKSTRLFSKKRNPAWKQTQMWILRQFGGEAHLVFSTGGGFADLERLESARLTTCAVQLRNHAMVGTVGWGKVAAVVLERMVSGLFWEMSGQITISG